MKHLNTILAITAVISAIDIRCHVKEHCRCSVLSWVNAAPDKCYASGSVCWAMQFVAIPKNWRLSTRSHKNDGCKDIVHVFNSNGRDSVCHDAPEKRVAYTGASYSFINKKRSKDVVAFDDQDCVKPDFLTIENGPTYTLAGLDDETVKIMVHIVLEYVDRLCHANFSCSKTLTTKHNHRCVVLTR